MSFSSSQPGNVSERQGGMLRSTAPLERTLACEQCGYVELYLDPEKLRTNLSKG